MYKKQKILPEFPVYIVVFHIQIWIVVDFYFFVKPKVTEEEVAEFMKPLEDRFKDKTVFYKVSYNREFSWVFIDFINEKIQPEEEEKIYIDENGNPMPNSNGMTVSFRNLAGEWTEYEYRDVKGKVEKDDQYKIILKGKEYKLEGIKHPNESYYYNYLMDDEDNLRTEDFMRDNYSSRELTTALKSSFLYFAEVDQNTIIAMPDENYIKEYIERECCRVLKEILIYPKSFDDKKGVIASIVIILLIGFAVYCFISPLISGPLSIS